MMGDATLPRPLLETADFIADRGAAMARAGRDFSAWTAVAIADTDDVTANDLCFLAWTAEIGYREGLEVPSC